MIVVKWSAKQDSRRSEKMQKKKEKSELDVLSWQRGYRTQASSGIEDELGDCPIEIDD